MSKKVIVLGVSAVLVLTGMAVGGYYYYEREKKKDAELRLLSFRGEISVGMSAVDRSGAKVVREMAPFREGKKGDLAALKKAQADFKATLSRYQEAEARLQTPNAPQAAELRKAYRELLDTYAKEVATEIDQAIEAAEEFPDGAKLLIELHIMKAGESEKKAREKFKTAVTLFTAANPNLP